MKLLRLRCRNIATYDNVDIDFEKLSYPVFVMGRTGAGKTTLFVDAVTAALYGRVYGEKSKELAKEFVMQGKTQGVVELEFEVEGRKYSIRRIFNRRGSSQAILKMMYPEDKIITTGSDNVTKAVEKLIGLNFEGLMNSAIVRQGGVYELIERKPAEKRKILQEMLRIKFEEMLKRLDDKLKILQIKIGTLRSRIDMLRSEISKEPELKKKLEEARKDLPSIRREIDNLEMKRHKLIREKDELQKKLGELHSKIEEMKIIDQEIRRRETKIANLKREIENVIREAQKFPPEAIERVDEIEEKITKIQEIETEIDCLKREIDEYQKKFQRYRRLLEIEKKLEELSNISSKYHETDKEIDKLRSKISEIDAATKQLKDALQKLDMAGATCPVCGSELPPDKKIERSKHLNRELNELQIQKERLEKELMSLQAKREELRKKNEEAIRLRGEYSAIKKELGDKIPSEGKLQELIMTLKEFERKRGELLSRIQKVLGVSNLSDARRAIRKIRELATRLREMNSKRELIELHEERIRELKEKRINIEKQISEYDILENRIKKLKFEISTIERKLKELTGRKGSLEATIRETSRRLEEIKEKKRQLEEYEEELEEVETDIRAHELLRRKVFSPGAFPAELMKEYLEFIEYQANEYLKTFGQNIEIMLKLEKTTKDSQSVYLEAFSGGFRRDIRTFSGGETTLIGFALRLAIGKLLAQIFSVARRPRFLIIDEGFGPLDSDRREAVADALAKLYASGEYEQIILISHQQDLKNHAVFQTVIEITKDSRGISHVRVNP